MGAIEISVEDVGLSELSTGGEEGGGFKFGEAMVAHDKK